MMLKFTVLASKIKYGVDTLTMFVTGLCRARGRKKETAAMKGYLVRKPESTYPMFYLVFFFADDGK